MLALSVPHKTTATDDSSFEDLKMVQTLLIFAFIGLCYFAHGRSVGKTLTERSASASSSSSFVSSSSSSSRSFSLSSSSSSSSRTPSQANSPSQSLPVGASSPLPRVSAQAAVQKEESLRGKVSANTGQSPVLTMNEPVTAEFFTTPRPKVANQAATTEKVRPITEKASFTRKKMTSEETLPPRTRTIQPPSLAIESTLGPVIGQRRAETERTATQLQVRSSTISNEPVTASVTTTETIVSTPTDHETASPTTVTPDELPGLIVTTAVVTEHDKDGAGRNAAGFFPGLEGVTFWLENDNLPSATPPPVNTDHDKDGKFAFVTAQSSPSTADELDKDGPGRNVFSQR